MTMQLPDHQPSDYEFFDFNPTPSNNNHSFFNIDTYLMTDPMTHQQQQNLPRLAPAPSNSFLTNDPTTHHQQQQPSLTPIPPAPPVSILPPIQTPAEKLQAEHTKLTTDHTLIKTKYDYANAGLQAAIAEWEKINNAAILVSELRVKKARLVTEKVGWQREVLEVEERICDIKEQEDLDRDLRLEEEKLMEKRRLLRGLIRKVPEAVRVVEMLLGPAERDYVYWLGTENATSGRMREWRNCVRNLDGWEMPKAD